LLPSDLDRRCVLAAFRRLGFTEVREGGNHTILTNPDSPGHVVIPRHARIHRATIRGELRRIGVSVEEFLDAY
jgi:predicted RNA binding protein YcfA (HicA-like mRNA interferase family)